MLVPLGAAARPIPGQVALHGKVLGPPREAAKMPCMAPRYDDLPRPAPETGNNSGLPLSWGTWGEDDQIGTFNRLTPETVAAAAAKIGVLVRGTENRQDYSSIFGAEDMRRFLWDSASPPPARTIPPWRSGPIPPSSRPCTGPSPVCAW
jgi:hypothetical protein